MNDEDMQRTLCAEFAPGGMTYDRVKSEWAVSSATTGWVPIGAGLFVTQQDIDLSGYAMARKTFYPYSSFEQRGGFTYGQFDTTLTSQPYATDVTIISSVPLSNNDLLIAVAYAPGFTGLTGYSVPVNRFERSNIIHGEMKLYTLDSNMAVPGGNNSLKLLGREIFSSLEPTAADKLYCYRIMGVFAVNGEGESAVFPATRVLLPGNISSEPQLEYMMRLKRSYELANQV